MNDLANRFIEVYNYLLKNNIVAGYKDFASKISVSTSMITEISKGRSNVGTTAVQNTVLIFPINADWLLTGRGSMLRTGQDQPVPLAETKPISPADEAFVYRMYKEEKEENKKLNAKMLKMAEEIGSLKRDIDFLVHQRGVDVPPALDVEDAV